jgi:hypothetical protein
MKRIHIVQPYNSIAMLRMTQPLIQELPKLYEVTTSKEVDVTADLNFHAPFHTMIGLKDKGKGKHILMYTHCNPPDRDALFEACEQADLITCMSFEGRRELISLGVDPKKLWVNYCGADNFHYRKRVITIVGYPQPNGRKREHILLDLAWQYDLRPYEFLFVGNGWEDVAIKLQNVGVSASVVYADDNGLKSIYDKTDIMLVTGYIEGGSLPVLEAMASGVPILSPKFGYSADLLDTELYNGVEDLYNKLYESTYKSILNHQVVKSWGWRDYVAEYAMLFGRLLDESVDLYPELATSRYVQILEQIDKCKPLSICEFGTWNGNRAIQMIQQSARYRKMERIEYTGYDLFETQTGEQFRHEFSKQGWSSDVVQKRLDATHAEIELVVCDTNDVESIDGADFFFIDGGHSLETVQHDWDLVQDAMYDNSVVIFDDYYTPKQEDKGCNEIIEELQSNPSYKVEILPVITETEELAIQMVKVTRANIRLSMRAETYTGNQSSDERLWVNVDLPAMQHSNATYTANASC